MKVRIKPKKQPPKDENAELKKALKRVAEARKSIVEFQKEYEDIFEEYHALMSLESTAMSNAKGFARELAANTAGAGKTRLLSQSGVSVLATYKTRVDVAELINMEPRVRDVARVTMTVTQTEVRKLLATGIVTQEQVDECTVLMTPAIQISIDQLDE